MRNFPQYRLIGGYLRIAEWIYCGVICGHKSGDTYQVTDGNRTLMVEECPLCGATQLLRSMPPGSPLVRIA
jgi:hypothetical protein